MEKVKGYEYFLKALYVPSRSGALFAEAGSRPVGWWSFIGKKRRATSLRTGGAAPKWRLRLRSEDSRIEALVVSQFTSFLTLLEVPLREEGFRFVRLDGTMSQKRWVQIIQSNAPNSPLIILLSQSRRGGAKPKQWGKKVFSQPPIVQVLPLKKMRGL